jgi:Concanavalin A-like lectin/glucanases superfamily
MVNLFKSGTTLSSGTIRRNNFVIAVQEGLSYGPTASTGFWAGITPPSGGYTIYNNKAANGPSIFTSTNDANVITTAQKLGGTSISTIYDALIWFNNQSDRLVTNIDYPSFPTDGLILNLDPGYIPSYPRTGATLNDLSQNQNNNTILDSSIITWSSGATGGGVLNFSKQTGKQITGNTEANLTSTGITLSVWVNFSAQTNTINRFITVDSEIAQIRRNGSTVEMVINAGGSLKAFAPTQSFTNNTLWYNVVCTYNSSPANAVIYINGAQVSATTTAITGAISTSSTGIKISSESTTECMEGKMSLFQIWNRALSATEVGALVTSFGPRFGI